MARKRDYLKEEADRLARYVGIIPPQKLPTPRELDFYRSKVRDGSHIGKNQLAAIFAALDDAVDRVEKAEARLRQADALLFMAETALGPRTKPGPERVCAAWALMHAMRDAGYEVDPAK